MLTFEEGLENFKQYPDCFYIGELNMARLRKDSNNLPNGWNGTRLIFTDQVDEAHLFGLAKQYNSRYIIVSPEGWENFNRDLPRSELRFWWTSKKIKKYLANNFNGNYFRRN
jgi:hypothetical protein